MSENILVLPYYDPESGELLFLPCVIWQGVNYFLDAEEEYPFWKVDSFDNGTLTLVSEDRWIPLDFISNIDRITKAESDMLKMLAPNHYRMVEVVRRFRSDGI